jgi:hypothetical protein
VSRPPPACLSMSAWSVRTSGRRDSFLVLPKASGNKESLACWPRPGAVGHLTLSTPTRHRFRAILREGKVTTLHRWIEDARKTGIHSLRG